MAAPREGLSEKGQGQFKNLLGGLYMLVRSVKMYEPTNAIFQRPLNALLDTCNAIVAVEGRLQLNVASGTFYGNGVPIKVDQQALENLRFLLAEMEARKVGGLTLLRPTTLQDLRSFISIFAKDQAEDVGEDGIAGNKLVTIQIARWKKIEEKLRDIDNASVDRKKYILTLYARAIYTAREYVGALKRGEPPPNVSSVNRLMQDLINVILDAESQFLGMTTVGGNEDTFLYHLVNSALIAVTFGNELGLSRIQLRELGLVSLFARASLGKLPEEWVMLPEPEKAAAGLRAQLQFAYHEAARLALIDFGNPRLRQLRAVIANQLPKPFGKSVGGPGGMVMSDGSQLLYTRILAISAYFDLLTSNPLGRDAVATEVALQLMWSQERARFDPELLALFVRFMANQPIKRMGAGTVDIAGLG